MRYAFRMPKQAVLGIQKAKAVLFGQLAFRLEYERAEDRLLFASLRGKPVHARAIP